MGSYQRMARAIVYQTFRIHRHCDPSSFSGWEYGRSMPLRMRACEQINPTDRRPRDDRRVAIRTTRNQSNYDLVGTITNAISVTDPINDAGSPYEDKFELTIWCARDTVNITRFVNLQTINNLQNEYKIFSLSIIEKYV